ncbi:4-(cytidine 5'-diphospho)-2-C-methyl-D-erythritol kinase [Bacilliculturomica massiliensis]|uniref:4-(cytidine 5'-diphospho)-2-C-methyl-D-erythritol kinase n=1 Tax=Bacilliculturomica massiliensis TaxID=1917867 RepID=UPI00102F5CFD|nr:4-(cytidine 5'-diphospho)-2-C-methyl-D-erythritol kinase [Bacilliculturomica massiliensis]
MKRYGIAKRERITLRAYAKINLSLDVLRRRPDGYHEVEMVMQAVELYDKVVVEWGPGGEGQSITVTASLPYLPVDSDNIAYKAARMMLDIFRPGDPADIRIHLEKHIPVAAGLAGGSADGAAVLRGLAQLWGLNLSLAELCSLGEQLGADVPFCLWAQEGLTCALAKGLGTELSALPPLDCLVLLSKPPLSVSTARVYGGLKLDEISPEAHPDTAALIGGLELLDRKDADPQDGSLRRQGLRQIADHMANLLETVTLPAFPRVRDTKERMEGAGTAAAVMMSGSGPTVFGLYEDEDEARKAYGVMKKINRETYLRRTYLG